MKFLFSLIQPSYVPCTVTKVALVCATHPNCSNKATYQVIVDSRNGEECSARQVVDCGC